VETARRLFHVPQKGILQEALQGECGQTTGHHRKGDGRLPVGCPKITFVSVRERRKEHDN